MSKVSVLISTMGNRIEGIRLAPLNTDVFYIVVHQQPVGLFSFQRDDVLYIASSDCGLSKSRNLAITSCSTKYAFVCDDDVTLDVTALLSAVEAAESMEVDIVTCRFIYSDGGMNSYPRNGFRHGFISATSVCSIEILIKVGSVLGNSILFDDRFGLGTSLPSGEEYIFLTDALKAGLVIKHSSQVVCIHPPITSGMDFFSTKEKVLAKRHMLIRVFGRWAPLFIALFFIKKAKVLAANGRLLFFAKNFFLKG